MTKGNWHKWKDRSYRRSVLWGGLTDEQRDEVIKRRDAARNAQHDKEDPQGRQPPTPKSTTPEPRLFWQLPFGTLVGQYLRHFFAAGIALTVVWIIVAVVLAAFGIALLDSLNN
jgi:hypothetical protein